jgi:hypothetical protein
MLGGGRMRGDSKSLAHTGRRGGEGKGQASYRTDAIEDEGFAIIIPVGANTKVNLLWVLVTLQAARMKG